MGEYSMTPGYVAYLQWLMRMSEEAQRAHPWWHGLTAGQRADWDAVAVAVIEWHETGVTNLTRGPEGQEKAEPLPPRR